MRVASIHIYCVKSLAGAPVAAAEAEPWGLRHDRRWLVVRPDGTVLTARREHRLLGMAAAPAESGTIKLTGLDSSTIHIKEPVEGEPLRIGLSRLESVRAAGAAADDWLSHQLGQSVRLGWLDDPRRRTVSLEHGGRIGDPLNLSDAGPLLLTTTASLRQVNDWLEEDAVGRGEVAPAPMVMARFRPSIVVDGVEPPFVEDNWRHVQIGGVRFRFAEQCDRCVMTTIDPQTLAVSKEPLRTLARHRRRDHKTWFGIRLIPSTAGTVRIGDAVAGG
jgi:MOSC domain-containing protein